MSAKNADDQIITPDNIHVTDAKSDEEAPRIDKPRPKDAKGETEFSTDNIHVTSEPSH